MTIFERSGLRIVARPGYEGGAGPAKARKIEGALWAPAIESWTWPLSIQTCHDLRAVYGDALEIGPELWAWADAENRRASKLEHLRAGAPANLPRLAAYAPVLHAALQTRPYQCAGTAFICEGRSVLLGDEPGLGKTYQALAAIAEGGKRRVLIAAPKTAVISVWERKALELLGDKVLVYTAQGTFAKRSAMIDAFNDDPIEGDDTHILIINLQMMNVKRMYRCPDYVHALACGHTARMAGTFSDPDADNWVTCHVCQNQQKVVATTQPEHAKRKGRGSCPEPHDHKMIEYPKYPNLFTHAYDMVILDESHHALASTANARGSGDKITQIKLGANRLPVTDDAIKLAMSGTPFRSKPPRSWGQLNWLRPDLFGSFWKFADEHFEVNKGTYGWTVDKMRDPKRFDSALRPYYLARTKGDVAPELPPITYAGTPPDDAPEGSNGVYLPMDNDQARAYREMAELAAARILDGRVTAEGRLAEITRLKQFAISFCQLRTDYPKHPEGMVWPTADSNKLEWIFQYLDEREGNDDMGKVVIASQFTKWINVVTEALENAGHEVLTLTGATSAKQRVIMQDRFQDPDDACQIAVINMQAGGEAITLDAADDMIFTDEPWTSDELEQVESRIHRVSRIHAVTVYRLRSLATIDDTIAGRTDDQRARIRAMKPQALAALLTGELSATIRTRAMTRTRGYDDKQAISGAMRNRYVAGQGTLGALN